MLSTTIFALGFSAPDLVVTPAEPVGWRRLYDAPADSTIDVIVQVQRQNLATLQEVALSVSTPGNPKYGRYMSQEQVDAITAPPASSVEAVRNWLAPAALTMSEAQPAGVIKAKLHAGRASTLLNTKFGALHSISEDRRLVRADQYTIPAAVAVRTSQRFPCRGLRWDP